MYDWMNAHSMRSGVQYVHCVMHTCIMVKVEGKRKTRKVWKNT